MTTVDQAETRRGRRLADAASHSFEADAPARWRQLVAPPDRVDLCPDCLFPIAYVVSAAFNADQTLGGASLIPRDLTLENFSQLLKGEVAGRPATRRPRSRFARWYANTMIVAGSTAILTVLLGALAAYAFSRFRFKGRRMGLLALLLIQMFPQLLLVVAIYLIVLQTGEVFGFIGLNTLTGLIFVYLGGVMGVNVWLMKGFFDTIPNELDESPRRRRDALPSVLGSDPAAGGAGARGDRSVLVHRL